jgi:hypothetical protein
MFLDSKDRAKVWINNFMVIINWFRFLGLGVLRVQGNIYIFHIFEFRFGM